MEHGPLPFIHTADRLQQILGKVVAIKEDIWAQSSTGVQQVAQLEEVQGLLTVLLAAIRNDEYPDNMALDDIQRGLVGG